MSGSVDVASNDLAYGPVSDPVLSRQCSVADPPGGVSLANSACVEIGDLSTRSTDATVLLSRFDGSSHVIRDGHMRPCAARHDLRNDGGRGSGVDRNLVVRFSAFGDLADDRQGCVLINGCQRVRGPGVYEQLDPPLVVGVSVIFGLTPKEKVARVTAPTVVTPGAVVARVNAAFQRNGASGFGYPRGGQCQRDAVSAKRLLPVNVEGAVPDAALPPDPRPARVWPAGLVNGSPKSFDVLSGKMDQHRRIPPVVSCPRLFEQRGGSCSVNDSGRSASASGVLASGRATCHW